MDIAGSVALVTGANRGQAFVCALLQRGAAKVYVAAATRQRSPSRMAAINALSRSDST